MGASAQRRLVQRGLAGAALLTLAACISIGRDGGPVTIAGPDAAERAARCGFDRAAVDRDMAPEADFVAYATGGWPVGAATDALSAAARNALGAVDTPADRFLAAYLARDPSDAAGAEGVLRAAHDLSEQRDRAALAEAAALAALRGGTTPFRVGAYPDPEDPSVTTLIVGAGGAPLGGPDAYEEFGEAYTARVEATLSLLGAERADRLARRVVAFERRLAQAAAETGNDYTERTPEALARLRRGDPWRAYLGTLGIETEAVQLRDIGALSRTTRAWRSARPQTIAAYLAFHRVSDVAGFLPPAYGGAREEDTVRAVAERLFAAEEGALLRGRVTPGARDLAEAVARAVLGDDVPLVIAGGPGAYAVPPEAEDATAEGVEAAALARGQARIARAGDATQAEDRLGSPLDAAPRRDRATGALDLPAALLQGPVFATGDAPATYGALGGLVAVTDGADGASALRRARAAYEASGAAQGAKKRCGLTPDQRFYVGFAHGLRGTLPTRTINAAVRADPTWVAAFGE